jgi:hypothetical protein
MNLIENRVLRKIFGPKGDIVTSVWRKPHRAELYDLHSLITSSNKLETLLHFVG